MKAELSSASSRALVLTINYIGIFITTRCIAQLLFSVTSLDV